MAIDMKALDRAAAGDPDGRVTVNKRWLREVHRKLEQGAEAEAELGRRGRMDNIFDALFPTAHRPSATS